MEPKYKRILLKLSGEAMAGKAHSGLDFDTVLLFCRFSGRSFLIWLHIAHREYAEDRPPDRKQTAPMWYGRTGNKSG